MALRDPKKAIRFVKAIPSVAAIPTATPIPIATPILATVEAPAPTETPLSDIVLHTIPEEFARVGWNKDKMLPGKDGQYNWFMIGANESDWITFLRSKGLLLSSAEGAAFSAAYTAIARQSEQRLHDRAFENTQ